MKAKATRLLRILSDIRHAQRCTAIRAARAAAEADAVLAERDDPAPDERDDAESDDATPFPAPVSTHLTDVARHIPCRTRRSCGRAAPPRDPRSRTGHGHHQPERACVGHEAYADVPQIRAAHDRMQQRIDDERDRRARDEADQPALAHGHDGPHTLRDPRDPAKRTQSAISHAMAAKLTTRGSARSRLNTPSGSGSPENSL